MSHRSKIRRGPKVHKLRRKLARRDGARCFYCRHHFTDLHTATFDHYIPYRVWRTHRQENLVLACWDCNQAKADRLPWPLVWALLAHHRAASTTSTAAPLQLAA